MHSQEFIQEMKQMLLERKAKLEEDLNGLSSHTELGDDLDSQAQEVEDDEVSQDVIARMKADIEKINSALAKIENGSYGVDDEGNEISEDRLKAIPWADKGV